MTEGRYFVMVTVQKDDPDLDNPGRSAWVHETGSKKLRSVSVDKIPVTLEQTTLGNVTDIATRAETVVALR